MIPPDSASRCYRLTELPYSADPLPRLAAVRALGLPVLLDSASGGAHGRYSILAAGPQQVITALPGETGLDCLARVRTALAALGPARWPAGIRLPFGAGALGLIGYDFGRRLERIAARARTDLSLPDLQLGLYAWSLVSDHQARRCWLVCHPSVSDSLEASIQLRLQQGDAAIGSFHLLTLFTPEQRRSEYDKAFDRVHQYILSGDCYQINLAQRFHARCAGDSLAAYDALRQACPTPFAAYIETAEHSILSLSPERFLRVDGGQVETRPIKGTRGRSSDHASDQALSRELAASLKDRSENLMIVDLLRNDLGRSCAIGSVRVPELFAIETYPNVHHLVSAVTGTLATGRDALDLIASAFPGGSITGAPKIRAMQIIEELEPVRRNLYCGSIGYLGCEGQVDLNIAIRTLLRQDSDLYLWGGGGIVADSIAEAEYQETLTKVRLLMDSLTPFLQVGADV
jgi:para-aminobenzoate synthetase component I